MGREGRARGWGGRIAGGGGGEDGGSGGGEI